MARRPDTNANRQYLAQKAAVGAWQPRKSLSEYKAGQINRKAREFRKQESAGLPLSNMAARGHATTKEHPGRKKAPNLTQYKFRRTPAAPPPPRTRQKLPQFVHTRPNLHTGRTDFTKPGIRPAPGERVFHWADTHPGPILDALREGATRGEYAILEAYDCSLGKWAKVPLRAKRMPIEPAAQFLSDWHRSRKTFERWAIDLINLHDSPTLNTGIKGAKFTHVCLWQVMLYAGAATGAA